MENTIPDIQYDDPQVLSRLLFRDVGIPEISDHLHNCWSSLLPEYQRVAVLSIQEAVLAVTDEYDNIFIELLKNQ